MRHFHPYCATDPKPLARLLSRYAIRALYEEVALYPKPGLVSFVDSGAHHDMDGVLFLRSLFTLRHYFYNVAKMAMEKASLEALVAQGVLAEQQMYRVTGGVNTHRGAIFALGIVVTSLATHIQVSPMLTPSCLHQAIRDKWALFLRDKHRIENTHGSVLRQTYVIKDAKQMAIEGYRLVFDVFERLQGSAMDQQWMGLMAYQHFLLHLDDQNILHRKGLAGLDWARDRIKELSERRTRAEVFAHAMVLHRLFSQHRISPGGVADMMGLFFFLRQVFPVADKPRLTDRRGQAIAFSEL